MSWFKYILPENHFERINASFYQSIKKTCPRSQLGRKDGQRYDQFLDTSLKLFTAMMKNNFHQKHSSSVPWLPSLTIPNSNQHKLLQNSQQNDEKVLMTLQKGRCNNQNNFTEITFWIPIEKKLNLNGKWKIDLPTNYSWWKTTQTTPQKHPKTKNTDSF